MSIEDQIEELLNDLEQEDTPETNVGTSLVSANAISPTIQSGGSVILSHAVHTFSAYGAPVGFILTK